MSDCIFCRIVAGEAQASFVHRDELVSAFLDIRPVTPGHLLVITNEQVVFIQDCPMSPFDRLCAIARRLARSVRQTDAIRADSINLFAPMARPPRRKNRRVSPSAATVHARPASACGGDSSRESSLNTGPRGDPRAPQLQDPRSALE
jgi:hypothetical protein